MLVQLFRAPHGTPFLNPNDADLPRVASVVRRHAVEVSWTFAGSSTLDWDCDNNVQCVLNNYLSYFSSGSSGIPLLHAVRGGTAGEILNHSCASGTILTWHASLPCAVVHGEPHGQCLLVLALHWYYQQDALLGVEFQEEDMEGEG